MPLSLWVKLINWSLWVPVDRKISGSPCMGQRASTEVTWPCSSVSHGHCLFFYLLLQMCSAKTWTFPLHCLKKSFFLSTCVLLRRGKKCAWEVAHAQVHMGWTCSHTDSWACFSFLVLQEISGETILSCELQVYFKNTSWKSIWLCKKL